MNEGEEGFIYSWRGILATNNAQRGVCQRSGIGMSSIALGEILSWKREIKLMPSSPSTPSPNGLAPSRWTATTTPEASALPTAILVAYPMSASAVPPAMKIFYKTKFGCLIRANDPFVVSLSSHYKRVNLLLVMKLVWRRRSKMHETEPGRPPDVRGRTP
jgi:hypothetical protein